MNIIKLEELQYELAEPYCCFENVERYCEEHGGSLVTGWLVHRMSQLNELIHHAVWRSPVGRLFEITPLDKMNLRGFVVDETAKRIDTGEGYVPLETRFVPDLDASPNVVAACEALNRSEIAFAIGQLERHSYYMQRANRLLAKNQVQLETRPVSHYYLYKPSTRKAWQEYYANAV